MSEETSSLAALVAERVAAQVQSEPRIVERAMRLLDEGLPVPYLARYRRVDVGGLGEDALAEIRRTAGHWRELEQRREFVLRVLDGREDVPGKVRKRIEQARSRAEIEYAYEPFRPHGRTSASIAREKGYGPIAEAIEKGELPEADDEAISGAVDILAHAFAADPEARLTLLRNMEKSGELRLSPGPGRKDFPARYKSLRDVKGKVGRLPPARLLAILRGESDGALQVSIDVTDEKVRHVLEQRHFPSDASPEVKAVLERALDLALRLMRTAVTRDALREARERAEDSVMRGVCHALHDQLLFPPAGERPVLGVDPAPRGSVPVACVGTRGELLEHARPRFFGKDEEKIAAGKEAIRKLVETHGIELIAIGNGRGRQECENFLRDALADREEGSPPCIVVNEGGVGAYAGSPLARRELPAVPAPIVGAVSIARRLQDPIAELTKLDPQQIVGGHGLADVDGRRAPRELREIVEHCVNRIGVDVNRAPAEQLAYVCGLGLSRGREIVAHREKNGPVQTRAQLREVAGMDDRVFELAAGFLRIHGGENALDATSVHPDRYPLVQRFAESKGVAVNDLVGQADLLADLDASHFADEKYSEPVVDSVVGALLEAGLDPRPRLEVAPMPSGIRSAADLKAGMKLPGRVTNVTTFGAFVDLGVQQDGLVHVSELADRFVKDPSAVVRVGELVEVRVLGVDGETGRISLSMRSGRPGGRAGAGKGKGRRDRDGGGRGRGTRRPPRRRDDRPEPAAAEGASPGRDAGDRNSGSRAVPVDAAQPVAPEPPEDPIPTDMSEEEFMRRKMEELKRRFG
jgi:uncharacterized protein